MTYNSKPVDVENDGNSMYVYVCMYVSARAFAAWTRAPLPIFMVDTQACMAASAWPPGRGRRPAPDLASDGGRFSFRALFLAAGAWCVRAADVWPYLFLYVGDGVEDNKKHLGGWLFAFKMYCIIIM